MRLGLQAGYLYTTPQPYLTPLRTRNEVLVGVTAATRTASGSNWRMGVSARYDLNLDRPVLIQGIAGYEDECFILEGRFVRRFARDPVTQQDYAGNTIVLIRLGFKTLGRIRVPGAVRFAIIAVERFEWPFTLRMPFRFGVITVRHGRQAVLRARIRCENGREGWGVAAETLAAKWFDKNQALSDGRQ